MFPPLSKVYSYTNPDYIEANSRGEITPEQAQILGPARDFLTGKFQRGEKLNGWVVILVLALFLGLQLLGIELTLPVVGVLIGLALVALAVQLGRRRIGSRRQRARLAEDLAGGLVREGVGELRFQGKAYSAVLPDRQLSLPFGSKEELAPGQQYRFYYLPGSGLVLSAEALEEISPALVQSGLTSVLASSHGFKLSSLSANRRGELTAEQTSLLGSKLVAPLLFFVIPAGFLFYQLRSAGFLNDRSPAGLIPRLIEGLPTGTIVVGGILLAASLFGLVLAVLTGWDILGRKVRSVEGPGYRKISTTQDDDGSTTTRLYYLIGGMRFQAQRQGFNAFEDGLTYRAYYTPFRKVLVNLEVLE